MSNSRSPSRDRYEGESDAESSKSISQVDEEHEGEETVEEDTGGGEEIGEKGQGFVDGMDPEGFSSGKIVKPLTPEALAAFKAAQERAGVIYISRIPPGMRPAKVRHLMSAYGEVGRVYLQQEDAKRAYLRKKYTATKKPHFTEGWVEFKDKKIARSVAEMLNAQPIGGKKGTRWRDDVWTMKYLPKFKWNMLTEQVAHEATLHTAKLRVELSQSKAEQREYLRNVELARVLDKRAERKREKGEEMQLKPLPQPKKRKAEEDSSTKKRPRGDDKQLESVLSSIF
ncbi:u3 snornp-associated protein esf2 [Moniliophthora roreri MCA 2997]|uniref:18S rRNA factor 2 n=2 Tax=Moniliophthora roreri TaxID=221103 RepID=V2WB48_MONRO|nr:u3 snornp-associated protein esf2 [Moniliophthora roreri MCA 2997]KAI3620984.1 u3 snornp-associated protein esf2 [Moniliophthora roreri]